MNTHTDTFTPVFVNFDNIDDLVATIIARAKTEIASDIEAGRVPASVATFSELHDYVDANDYGGLTDIPVELNLANTVQDALDAWLRNGRR